MQAPRASQPARTRMAQLHDICNDSCHAIDRLPGSLQCRHHVGCVGLRVQPGLSLLLAVVAGAGSDNPYHSRWALMTRRAERRLTCDQYLRRTA